MHLPNGYIHLLHNEQEICGYINAKRAEGFSLDVNPKWGWDIDEEGKLFIPSYYCNGVVHEVANTQHQQIESLEEQLSKSLLVLAIEDNENNRDIILKYEESNNQGKGALPVLARVVGILPRITPKNLIQLSRQIKNIRIATTKYASEVELVNTKVAIEKLRLEPDIIYSEYVNNKGEKPEDLGETKAEAIFRKAG